MRVSDCESGEREHCANAGGGAYNPAGPTDY